MSFQSYLEPILSFLHISAILGWIVFASSQAAICRGDWFNAAVVQRLRRLDGILWIATAAVLVTGLARTFWGAKGMGWYWINPLLHIKITLFLVAALLQVGPTRQYRRWQTELERHGQLPDAEAVAGPRKLVMVATHLVALIPLPAVFLARGFGA